MEHAAPESKKPERRQYNRLTARFVETVAKPGRHGDGHGLYLHVKPSGSRSWLQRLTINGRKHDLGLGGYPLVSLAEARQAAFENRKLARSGGDPLALRRMAAVPTFEEAAATVIDLHRPTWSNAKHATQWEVTLRDYCLPAPRHAPCLGDRDRRHHGCVDADLARQERDRPSTAGNGFPPS